MTDPTQPLDIASLLGGQQKQVSLGDIVALLSEMRARKQAEAQVSTSPLAQIMSSLVQPAQMASSNSLQGYLGNKLAMMNNEDARMGQLDKLKSGNLIPLDQLQQHNGPPAGNFLDDLAGLGISPEDFKAILGIKPQAQAAPVAPSIRPAPEIGSIAGPESTMAADPIGAFIAHRPQPTQENTTPALIEALQRLGYSDQSSPTKNNPKTKKPLSMASQFGAQP